MFAALRKIPLYVKILLGMVLGLLFGFVMVGAGVAPSFVSDWVSPLGDIFMRLLKMIAVPLVFCSLVLGVGNLSDVAALSKLGVRTLLLYISTTVVAVTLGVVLVLSFQPGKAVSTDTREHLMANHNELVASSQDAGAQVVENSPLHFFVDMVPENIFEAFGSNALILQVIVVALLMGIAMLLIGAEKSAPVLNFCRSLNDIVLKIIDLIMSFAPVGVFALMSALVVGNAGDTSVIVALGYYASVVIFGLLLLILGFYPLLVRFVAKRSVKEFLKAMWPVQLLGFTTSSRAATLPLTMKQSRDALGISPQVANFVLPVGTTINMDGTSLYQAVAAIFIAEVFAVDLSFVDILTVIGTTIISSIGTPGIPGGSVVILVMVLWSAGIPAEGLALILGLDRPLDMLRTVANVTGDVTVASIVDRFHNKKKTV